MTTNADEVKACQYCGAEFERREDEHPCAFKRRKCCTQHCASLLAGLANRKGKQQGVYLLRHIKSGLVYVGSTSNMTARRNLHIQQLRTHTHHSKTLQRDWDRYGREAFEFVFLEAIDDPAQRLEREQFWMDQTRCSEREFGYNNSPTAGNCKGLRASAETRAKLSEATKGRNIGSKHGNSKLNEAQVAEIRIRLAKADKIVDIAQDYNVSFQTIDLIRRGLTWTHVDGPKLSSDDRRKIKRDHARGSNNPSAKLDEWDVREIKRRLARKDTQTAIAREYGVSKNLIGLISSGRIWKHVEAPSPLFGEERRS